MSRCPYDVSLPNCPLQGIQFDIVALTLRGLVAQRSLGLRVLAGHTALDTEISWVHPTELADPTAFLDGGELLLTTGLALDEEPPVDYVGRLVSKGVAGVGFGIGLSHDTVPAGLVAAADAAGLPLLEVAVPTPFIAITRAVSSALAADRYAALVRTGRGQQELTRTALRRRGPGALVRKLAQLIDGWVLLLDGVGTVREAAPAAATALGGQVRAELDRVRSGARVVTVDGAEAVLQALGTRARGFLAVGRPSRLDAADQHIVATAAALLSLSLERDRTQGAALRGLRTGLLELLLAGRTELALGTIERVFGAAPAAPWPVVVFTGAAQARATAVDVLETEGEPVFFAELAGAVIVLGETPAVTQLPNRIPGLHAGISAPTVDTGSGYRQALRAAEAAHARRVPLVRFADHAAGGLLGLLDPQTARAFADDLLAPLRGRGELETSLRCWLAHNGQWDGAATRLGVHRHTLRNRMAKVSELLDRDLDSPGVRAELWLALQVADLT
ncbi:PucR family transcriptional regulator [Saccharomonospora sp. NPDC046836]|uniref:PucR family transcriptional regulator n=1 Tax=Saccharomonospora sp. NPDC046836 TaxID=3156921 RepID=UPI0033F71176